MVSPRKLHILTSRDEAYLVFCFNIGTRHPAFPPIKTRIPASVQKCSLTSWIRWPPDYRPYPKAKHYLMRPDLAGYEI